jgi:hypothetical protein
MPAPYCNGCCTDILAAAFVESKLPKSMSPHVKVPLTVMLFVTFKVPAVAVPVAVMFGTDSNVVDGLNVN